MKRLIALLIVAVFCITIFSPSASAVCPDPNNTRFVRGGMPNGDDGAWNEADSPGDGEGAVLPRLFGLYISKHFVVYFVPKIIIGNSDSLDKYDPTDLTDTERSREASSR